MQQPLHLPPPKTQFFHDGRHYSVHREGSFVVITFGVTEVRRFRNNAERTELEQRAQWRIEEVDPTLILDDTEDGNAET